MHSSTVPGAFQYGWTPFKTVPIFARLKLIGAGFGVGMVRQAFLRENGGLHHLHELRIPILLSLPVFLVERRDDDPSPVESALREAIIACFQH